jgi:hypothetical protein
MKGINIFLFILCILFLIIFLSIIFLNNNKLIKIRVTKDPIDSEEENNYINIIKNKYLNNDCNKVCKKEICNEYHSQKIKYDLCKECNKENKCYNQYEGICVPCKNNYTCEQLFGCGDEKPINPIDNLCTRCWNK